MNKPLRLWNDYDRPHADLREAIERMERAGELLRIRGADWKLEMGALAEIVYRQDNPPAILFEDIPGYPGCRAASGLTNSARRMAITLGFPVPSHPLDCARPGQGRAVDLARQARAADPREVLQAGQTLPGADQLRPRSAAVPRRRQRDPLRPVGIRLRGRASRRAVRRRRKPAAWPADAGARRDRARRRDAPGRHAA